ncbi:dynamin family protein [Cellulomonas fimi]|uniref:dynamin family protein n=1 Tax=Cellulomonas fimi TaxID=1708 RepID=UPI00234E319A|nr:dynamin family protein [Cellulomonas fimi]MDC7122160.1 dynamin family protein [Cellulomonas fimi]
MTTSETKSLVDALLGLRDALDAVSLPFVTPVAAPAEAERRRLLDQLDDHLLPRVRDPDAATLVVVGGSTGAGKSTLLNSLLGEHVSTAGVLRPTTRSPVLVHHPDDAPDVDAARVLPGLARLREHTGGSRASDGPRHRGSEATGDPRRGDLGTDGRALRTVASTTLPRGLALVDAPDVDSVEEANRDLAGQLLRAADAWLFVTTAARYADAVPWELLAEAQRRRTHLAIVLDRVDAGTEDAVTADLRRMLADRGLGDAAVHVVRESTLEAGLLPEVEIAGVADWLMALALDPDVRARAVAATRDGAVLDVAVRARVVADAADDQRVAADRLRDAVAAAYDAARTRVAEQTSDGTMLRGEVLARWQDVVGTGEWFRRLEAGVSRVRDRVVGAMTGRRAADPGLAQAVGHGVTALVVDAAEDAASRAHADWHHDPAGQPLLQGLALSRASADLRVRAEEQVRAWQDDVLELVRGEGAEKRATARAVSFGVNGLGAALMVAVFASTGGLTGAEVGIVGGTALLAQRLLEAVFGDEAVRRLTRTAHERLDARVARLLDTEASRFTSVLEPLAAGVVDGGALRARASLVEVAARAATGDGGEPAAGAAARTPGSTPTAGPGGRLRGSGLGDRRRDGPRRDADRGDATGVEPAGTDEGGLRGWWARVRRGGRA